MNETQATRFPERDRNEEGRAENARPRDRFGRPLPRGAVDEMVHKEEPEDVVSTVEEAFDRAVALFDEERFFEAHEFLEYVWKHESIDPADRDFWKGVTQVAVGCCHTQRGNTAGAVRLLERAVSYLDPYPDQHRGVDKQALSHAALRVAGDIEEHGAGPHLEFPASRGHEPARSSPTAGRVPPGERTRDDR